MRFLKYWWRRFITWFENLFKKTQKEQDLDAPAPLKEDLDAPVPANNNIKGNPLFQRYATVAMANGCIANERHYVSNNNLEENNMGLLQSKVIKFLGGTPAPTSEDECKQQIKELEKKKLKFQNKEGVAPIKPVGQEKLLSSNISPISMRSNNDNSNWIDPDDLNNTFEVENVNKKMLNGINNKMDELMEKKGEQIKREVRQELEGTKQKMDTVEKKVDKNTEDIKKNTEDIKKNTEDIKKTQEEQIDIKKLLAKHDEQIADNKRRLDNQERMLADIHKQTEDIRKQTEKMEENQKAHDEIMAMLWNKLDEWNGIKQPTREGSDNRESTNTSFSSFKYKNPFRNNKWQPRMERPDMAHSQNNEY